MFCHASRRVVLGVAFASAVWAISSRPVYAQAVEINLTSCVILAGDCSTLQESADVNVSSRAGKGQATCSGILPEPLPHNFPNGGKCTPGNTGLQCLVAGVPTSNWSENVTPSGNFSLKCKL
jgi:hypothetical protein